MLPLPSNRGISRSAGNLDSLRDHMIRNELMCGFRSRTESSSRQHQRTGAFNNLLSVDAEKSTFRKQLTSIPDELRENARFNYVVEQDLRRRNLQDFQFKILVKLEKIIRKNVMDSGLDYGRYNLGGNDKGAYEKIFRIEPSQHMSRAQFLVALQKVFGLDVGMINAAKLQLFSEKNATKLYESFEQDSSDGSGMNWRHFLFLLALIMKPDKECDKQLMWAFSLCWSTGALDVEGICGGRVLLLDLKDVLCVPLKLSSRPSVRGLIEQSWAELVFEDEEAGNISDAALRAGRSQDMCSLPSRLCWKLLKQTSVSALLAKGEPFGKTGTYYQLLSLSMLLLGRPCR